MFFLSVSILWMTACGDPKPVLQGLEEQSILAKKDLFSAPQKKNEGYQKSPQVYIDVFYLGGRSYTTSKGIIAEQFGQFQEVIELPMGKGMRYRFEKGNIQVLNDEIYMIQIDLPELKRRSESFRMMGFPDQIDKYIITHREYIVKHQWEFLRFRLYREDKNSEMVTRFEAWKWDPKDR